MTDHRSETENPSRETSTSDREWFETIRRELDPGDRTANDRASFRMRIDERLESRRIGMWQPRAAMAFAAVAAVLMWFAMPVSQSDPADGSDEIIATASDSDFLSYAYYETDYLPSRETTGATLSDEYQAIANAFDVP